jgi:16S rRNA A1518/A1519 N6-dimethyltransferase RsmA/KsgA/DIM1 with predicted DNA glycosylase/AP lyase activity
MRRVLRELWSVEAAIAERALEEAGVDPMARPETLSPEHFARLTRGRPR